jgi:hypothetical protein
MCASCGFEPRDPGSAAAWCMSALGLVLVAVMAMVTERAARMLTLGKSPVASPVPSARHGLRRSVGHSGMQVSCTFVQG